MQRLDSRQNLGEIRVGMHSLNDRPVETAARLSGLEERLALSERRIGPARSAQPCRWMFCETGILPGALICVAHGAANDVLKRSVLAGLHEGP